MNHFFVIFIPSSIIYLCHWHYNQVASDFQVFELLRSLLFAFLFALIVKNFPNVWNRHYCIHSKPHTCAHMHTPGNMHTYTCGVNITTPRALNIPGAKLSWLLIVSSREKEHLLK